MLLSVRYKLQLFFITGFIFVVFLSSVSSIQALETAAKQAYIIDYQTGAVLLEKNSNESMAPSSMSKIMTAFMLFERLKESHLSLDDTFLVSKKAWKKGGSKMFVRVDTRVRVEDLIRGIIVSSGNDACIVVAEGIAGSENAFAKEMTLRAHQLGMTSTNFTNSSGWPDRGHYTTAKDLALLARESIRRFPEYYHYYSEKDFTYSGIKQGNRNPLLYKEIGADGLKTGHTEVAGYGLIASVMRNGRRLIIVLNGLPSMKSRSRESQRLIDWAFREFDNYVLFKAGDIVDYAQVWLGDTNHVSLIVQQDLTVTLPRRSRRKLHAVMAYDGPIPAPISRGIAVADLSISAPGFKTQKVPLVAGESIKPLGTIRRLGAVIQFILWGENR